MDQSGGDDQVQPSQPQSQNQATGNLDSPGPNSEAGELFLGQITPISVFSEPPLTPKFRSKNPTLQVTPTQVEGGSGVEQSPRPQSPSPEHGHLSIMIKKGRERRRRVERSKERSEETKMEVQETG